MKKLLWSCIAALLVAGTVPAFGALAFSNTSHTAGGALAAVKVDDALAAQIASAPPTDRIGVILHADTANAAAHIAEAHGLQVGFRFDRVGAVSAFGAAAAVAQLSGEKGLRYVEADLPLVLNMQTSHKATRGQEALDGFTGTDGAVSTGVDGTGVTIAVVDSGIDGTHPMFQENGVSRVVRNLKLACRDNIVVPVTDATDCEGAQGNANDDVWIDVASSPRNDTDTISGGGHGTHVAGIAAGGRVNLANGTPIHGAAPGAKLIGLSVGASLSISGAGAGLNWVLEHHADPCVDHSCPAIRIVNNSYGPAGGGAYNPQGLTAKLGEALVAEGVVMVWANGNGDVAGNGGTGADNRSNPPGQSPVPGVISVANYDDGGIGTRDGSLDSSSSRGQSGALATYPDISAPGSNITSACTYALTICRSSGDVEDPEYAAISGTSMAAPHIAGIVAQLLQAKPSLNPRDVEDVLEDTAYKFSFGGAYEPDLPARNDGTTSFDKGHGLVDAMAAVARVRNIPITATPAPVNVCAGSRIAVDPTGDGTDKSVDIQTADMSWNATTGEVTTTIKAKDIGTEFPATYNGDVFYVDFSVAGRKYYVTGGRTQLEGEAYAFGRPRPGAENIRDTLTTVGMRGAYDTVADTVTIVLTQAAIDDANAQLALDVPATPPIPPLANGFVFPDVKVVSYLQRSAVVVSSLPAGDTAGSGCTYTLGSGSGPATIGGGTPPPSGSPDSTLSAPGSSYSWEGGPFTDFNQFGIFSPCAAPDYQGCDVKRVDLRSTSGPFTVHIRSDAGFPVVTDFDLTVYGPDGAAVGSSAAIGADETVVVNNPVPGVYTIVVSVASAVEDTYQGTATAG